MTDPATILDRLAARAQQLYSLPAVAMQVLELTKDPLVDTRAIKDCIENDPAMASRVLRVVNSSLFGLSREVSDLNQALALLGIKPLKLLVLSFSLPSGLFLDIEAKTLGWYWRHALTKAVAAREMSQELWRIPGDEAFLAGLFQDLGILVLLQQLGKPFARFLQRAISGHIDLAAGEVEALGFSHNLLTAKLLAQWKLPESLIEAVAWQPPAHGGNAGPTATAEASSTPPAALAKILHLAELVSRLLADGRPETFRQLLETGRAYHPLLASRIEPLLIGLEEKIRQLAAILSLQLPGGVEYRDVLAEAHRQLARVASQVAEDMLHPGRLDASDAEDEIAWDGLEDLMDAVSMVTGRREPPHPAVPAPAGWGLSQFSGGENGTVPLGNTNLLSRLDRAIMASRRSRRPLSLMLVELGCDEPQIANMGPEQFDSFLRLLETLCRNVDHPLTVCVPHGKAGFALILSDCERRQAVEFGNQLIRALRQSAPAHEDDLARTLKLGVGVATVASPPKNFSQQDLLAGAERCLFGSHTFGGGVVKSIEIY